MAPESQKPDAPTEIKTENLFKPGEHPTDLVRPFGQGELADVHDELQKRGVPDVIPINPTTLDVPVEKIPLTQPEQKAAGWKKWVAGVIGGAVLTGGGVVAGKSMSENDPSEPSTRTAETPTAIATVEPPFSPVAPEAEPTEVVDTPESAESVSIDRIMGTPTAEQIDAAINVPVSIADYPTAIDAVKQFGNLSNIYAKSGLTEWQGDTLTFTPDTETTGEQILENMYGPNLNDQIASGHREFRLDWSLAIDTDPYPELMVYFEPDTSTLQELGNGLYSIEVDEIHEDSAPNNANRGQDFRKKITLEQSGDRWYRVSNEELYQIDQPS